MERIAELPDVMRYGRGIIQSDQSWLAAHGCRQSAHRTHT
ncbi:hypothetical protein I553_2442 [Mycobacterium xenopi 4042]|uniref:Uncharacterized protein n=1 Tax=Mycobacterium xenopi 4042 TaxID=1299334 RepID=X8C8Y3_MYCXE|nr:hypothetical protein I553_2442 [Mycobacterium xenopi 4042]